MASIFTIKKDSKYHANFAESVYFHITNILKRIEERSEAEIRKFTQMDSDIIVYSFTNKYSYNIDVIRIVEKFGSMNDCMLKLTKFETTERGNYIYTWKISKKKVNVNLVV